MYFAACLSESSKTCYFSAVLAAVNNGLCEGVFTTDK